SGWLYVADLGGPPPPGRYWVATFEGWSGEFNVAPAVITRVIETDLLPITGIGPAPWPPPESPPARRPPVGTPWQGSRGIPPYKQQGDGNRLPQPRERGEGSG